MSYQIAGNDDVQLLTGRGIEILFARGTTVAIGCFCNGSLICLGEQDSAAPSTLSLTPSIVGRMEAPTLVLSEQDEAA